MLERKSVHVMIHGNVQGVGFRAWTERQAQNFHLDGWVRNRPDGTVEAVFAGPTDVVDEMVEYCFNGPEFVRIDKVDVGPGNDPGPGSGFHVTRTA